MKFFSFFKKVWPSKKKDEDGPSAVLHFEVDKGGVIWVDCAWDDKPGSHISFADLAYKVMYAHLVEETLVFLKNECEREGMDAQFLEVFEHMTALEEFYTIQSQLESEPESSSDEVVVKPTEIAKRIRNDE